jgi:hypothetical protein
MVAKSPNKKHATVCASTSQKCLKKPSGAIMPGKKILKKPSSAPQGAGKDGAGTRSVEILYTSTALMIGLRLMMVNSAAEIPELQDVAWIRDNYQTVHKAMCRSGKGEGNDFEICENMFTKFNNISLAELKAGPGYCTRFLSDMTKGGDLNSALASMSSAEKQKLIGHTSMSVGDIVCLQSKSASKYYLCVGDGFDLALVVNLT